MAKTRPIEIWETDICGRILKTRNDWKIIKFDSDYSRADVTKLIVRERTCMQGYVDQETLVNDVLSGEQRGFYPNGLLMYREYYTDGVRHGPKTVCSKDGQIKVQSYYINGKHGSLKQFQSYEKNVARLVNNLLTFHEKGLGKLIAEFSVY